MSSPEKASSDMASSPSHERAPGNMADAPNGASGMKGVRRSLVTIGTRLFNPLTARFAGSRYFPLYALVRHHGRRSGRAYATPVVAHPTPDGFLIPLAFGEGADWFRNVRAAGGCVVRWRGIEYQVVEPEVVEWATVRSAFSPVERLLVPLFGATRFVRLHHAHREGITED